MDFTENSLARFFRDSALCWFGYVPFLPWNETGGKKNYETNLIDKRENSKKLENENDERRRHITSLKSHREHHATQPSWAQMAFSEAYVIQDDGNLPQKLFSFSSLLLILLVLYFEHDKKSHQITTNMRRKSVYNRVNSRVNEKLTQLRREMGNFSIFQSSNLFQIIGSNETENARNPQKSLKCD